MQSVKIVLFESLVPRKPFWECLFCTLPTMFFLNKGTKKLSYTNKSYTLVQYSNNSLLASKMQWFV